MAQAWVDGQPARIDAATAAAGRLLGASRAPLIAGLGTDVAGARAVVALARRIGAAVDHMHSDALLRDLAVLREAGMMLTTPGEARVRADLLLLVGPGLLAAWPDLSQRVLAAPLAAETGGGARRIVWLCPGRSGSALAAPGIAVKTLGRTAAELPVVLAALRARLAGRPVGPMPIAAKAVDAAAAELKTARFGVAVWSAADLDPLALEMLCGIVADLNAATRFTGLPLGPADNARGVLQVLGWSTTLPVRTGFARAKPEHDPWRLDARRLVTSGETDCLLWISAYAGAAPPGADGVPTIALTGAEASFAHPPRVQIAVGRPGIDHDCVEHCAASGTLAAVQAAAPREIPSVAQIVAAITAALPAWEPAPC